MSRRIHQKVFKRKPGWKRGRWVWCNGRQKTRMSGTSCDCGARTDCL